MRQFTSFLLLACLLFIQCIQGGSTDPQVPFGDVRNCPTTSPQKPSQPIYQLEVLPGIGFDNLRSIDMGQVLNYNFSRCQTTKDRKYLLPDNVFVIPVKQSRFTTSAEYFDHWNNYTLTTSVSMSAGSGIADLISAKFSTEYKHVKSRMYNDETKLTRAQVRIRQYTIKVQPDSPLHPIFMERLLDIAAFLQRNDIAQARYLAELVVRDFGTHCITSVEAGAAIVETSYLKSSYVAQLSDNSFSFKQSASGALEKTINLKEEFDLSVDKSHIDSFMSNRTHSEFITYGGPSFAPHFSLSDWEAGVAEELVAIDRSGIPLYSVITPNTLPDLHLIMVQMVSDTVQEAVDRFYRINTRHGCTNPKASNFDFHANVDNHICDYPKNNYTFGGIYQTCAVDPNKNYKNLCTDGPQASQRNPLTGNFSCPTGYIPVMIHSGSISQITHHVPHEQCHRLWYTLFIKKKCVTVYDPEYSNANYEAYWCAGTKISENSGYLFGGLFTSSSVNPVTNTKGCPPYFIQLHMGEDIRVCVSDDYERSYATSIPFAGFQSCQAGNPLAARQTSTSWPHECPVAYAQHLVSVENGCEINYCVKMGAFASQSAFPARLPPFHKPPKFKVNDSEALALIGIEYFWIKNSDGRWVPYQFVNELNTSTTLAPTVTKKLMPSSTVVQSLFTTRKCNEQASTEPSATKSSNTTAVLILCAVLVILIITVVILILVLKIKRPSIINSKKSTKNEDRLLVQCENSST